MDYTDVAEALGNASAYLSTIPISTEFEYKPISFVDNVTKLNAENMNTLTASIGEIQEHIKDNDSIASTLSGYLNTIVSYLNVNEGHYHDLIVSTTENVAREILQNDTIDDYIDIKVTQARDAKNAESAASATVAHGLSPEADINMSQITWTSEEVMKLGVPFTYNSANKEFTTSYDIYSTGNAYFEGPVTIENLDISDSNFILPMRQGGTGFNAELKADAENENRRAEFVKSLKLEDIFESLCESWTSEDITFNGQVFEVTGGRITLTAREGVSLMSDLLAGEPQGTYNHNISGNLTVGYEHAEETMTVYNSMTAYNGMTVHNNMILMNGLQLSGDTIVTKLPNDPSELPEGTLLLLIVDESVDE